MEIKTKKLKGCTLVTIGGRVDSGWAPDLEKLLLGLIAVGEKNIVLSCGDLRFVSSAGLKVMWNTLRKARMAIPAGDLVVSQMPPEIKESFELVGFDRLFKFFDSDADAIKHFQAK